MLAAELATAAPAVKATLIDVLATRRAQDAVPAFVAATVDDNAQIRSAAMTALGQIGGPEQVASMLPGVLKSEKGGERDSAEKNVALVCARIPSEDQRADALIKALDGMNADQRDQLLTSLVGRVGGKKLINFVAEIRYRQRRRAAETGHRRPQQMARCERRRQTAGNYEPGDRSRRA